jgi:glycosyltransferase involved in cell wall biosynthesis
VRILSVAWECPVGWYGGLGVYVSKLLPEMARNHEVDHYCLHGDIPPGEAMDYFGARVMKPEDVLIDKNHSVFYRTAIALASHLYKHLGRYDVVVGHDPHSSLAIIYANQIGVRTVYSIHLFSNTGVELDSIRNADSIAVNSRLMARLVSEATGVAEDKLRVVYPAPPYPLIPNKLEKDEHRRPVIVIPSRFQSNKDPSRIIQQLSEAKRRVDFSVVVFGRASELYRLPDWVSVAGTVTEEQKLALYRDADLVLMVGFPEPFGLVSLEAVSQGAPVLVPETSGSAEVLPSESVYTSDNLAEKIVQLLRDRDKLEELWEKQKDSWIMRRTWRDVWIEYEEIIKKEV